ncbi:MAG TPA: HAD-IB family hydrolase [Candidatus Acidoferrales bacterium]|nr:HAD-IB family hydrolase [Candidatus Acidoferrales bacterium]
MNPENPVGAFFDLDKTLLPAPSIEKRFLIYAANRGKLGPTQLARWLARFARTIAVDPVAAAQGNKTFFAGMSTSITSDWEARLRARPFRFFSAGLQLLEWHAARGHRIFLVTGAPAPLAEIAARHLPLRVEIIATQLEERDGRWSGRIRGEHMCGAAKRRAIERIAAKAGIELACSFAYGDSYFDVDMLECVAFPAVVNPTELLNRLAQKRGWPILEWHATEARSGACALNESRISPQPRESITANAYPLFGVNR